MGGGPEARLAAAVEAVDALLAAEARHHADRSAFGCAPAAV